MQSFLGQSRTDVQKRHSRRDNSEESKFCPLHTLTQAWPQMKAEVVSLVQAASYSYLNSRLIEACLLNWCFRKHLDS